MLNVGFCLRSRHLGPMGGFELVLVTPLILACLTLLSSILFPCGLGKRYFRLRWIVHVAHRVRICLDITL